MNTNKNIKSETLYLRWYDPRTQTFRDAGVAFYNENYGEYLLRIDEDEGRQYYLKLSSVTEEKSTYRMELVLKRKNGSFLRRQCVGEGFSSLLTDGNVHIQYGSKYATLVLGLKN